MEESRIGNDSTLNRRSFLVGLGVSAATLGLSGCSPASDAAVEDSEDLPDTSTTPVEITAETVKIIPPERNLSLEELNQRRQDLVDSKTEDYQCEDGRIIPNVFVKLRALLDSYSFGVGSIVHDHCFDEIMYHFSPEDAQVYLEMPMGVLFDAAEYASKSGRNEAECEDICADLASRGLLYRSRTNGKTLYHQLAEAHGIWEYNLDKYELNDGELPKLHATTAGKDAMRQLCDSQTTFYNAIPCTREVVGDTKIALPYDDYEELVSGFDTLAVSPCQCRMSKKLRDIEDPGNHPIETCITTGEEAEYYLENGIGRQITKEEALDILHASVDAGMVIQVCNTKKADVICSCHGDCCGILGTYVAIAQNPDDDPANYNGFKHLSHYELRHNEEECLKCGACEKQCPLFAITMDEETGYPTVNGTCVRCGQCGRVCPVGARTLHLRPEILELPEDLLDDYNLRATYRFEHGMIS